MSVLLPTPTVGGDRPAPRFPHLFSPLRIGGVTLKNRILSSGHDTVMAEHGLVGDQLLAYHEARARGGVGLIVLQVSGVHESARYSAHLLMATDDASIPGYRRVAEAVHPHGCAVFAQLFHPGREIMESQDGSAPVALAPSSVPSDRFRVVPRAMPAALIREVIAGYAAAATRIRAAGLDGVEIVASHGYLPAQFLDPAVNRRTDEYGGSDENRLRFLREVIAAVRAAVGDSFVVGLRISADERGGTGIGVDATAEVCARLEADGGLDYLSVCAGTSATHAGSDHIAPPMTESAAYTAPLAAAVTSRVSLPVMVAGRINQPQEAEQVLASGQADACAMTRALICDPELPAKAGRGDLDDIRACVACNQACISHFHAGYPISCIQHPETGRELTYGTPRRTERRRRVLVVGGGPAGMKAAAVSAERGHDVVLVEAAPRLGGQVRLAERLPGRAEFGGVLTNLGRGGRARGRRRADPHHRRPRARRAAGPGRRRPRHRRAAAAPGSRGARRTHDPRRVGRRRRRRGARGPGRRRRLALRLGRARYSAGERLQQYVRDAMLAQAARAAITILPNTRPYGLDDDTVYLQHTLSLEPVIVDDVAALVLAAAPEPDCALQEALAGYAGELQLIGDCLAPRTVEEAVLEGMKVGFAV